MNKEAESTSKLGIFITIGLVLFIGIIYFIGKQKNLFGETCHLRSQFKNVSGLKVGNNVRFSGINVGTIEAIDLLTDSTVVVDIIIKKEIQPFIKTNAKASISSDGLMGDKILIISSGGFCKTAIKENDQISSKNAIEVEEMMMSMKSSLDNIALISKDLTVFTGKMNSGNGALSKLISDEEFSNSLKFTLQNLQSSSNDFARFANKMNDKKGALSKLMNDEKFGKTLDSTMANLQAGSKGLSENMEAAKSNIFFKGYYNKKKKEEELKKNVKSKPINNDSTKN
jgi:phospholipid/cholesterol/gamma-HCH transport system substrate-binding protein